MSEELKEGLRVELAEAESRVKELESGGGGSGDQLYEAKNKVNNLKTLAARLK